MDDCAAPSLVSAGMMLYGHGQTRPAVNSGSLVQGGYHGQWEPQTRLLAVVNSWIQRESGSVMQDDARRHVGDESLEAAKGPFYAPLFLRHQTLSTPPMVQQLKAQCKCSWNIKVFPQLRRAVAFVDERLFLWNYITGRDPLMYEARGVVTGLEVARPKPGVFASHVHYLLVITTFASVELVAVHVKDSVRSVIYLQDLPEYVIAGGNVIMESIATFEGKDLKSPRIFVGGNDGCVYELLYEAQDGWLRRKMHLQNMSIVGGDLPVVSGLVYKAREGLASFFGYSGIRDLQVDATRNYLYALDSAGSISMWWLGSDADNVAEHVRQFQCKVAGAGPRDSRPVSIHPIPKHQRGSDYEILCVLLEDGSRLLFSSTTTHEGRRQLQPPRAFSNNDLRHCPMKALSQLPITPAAVGSVQPSPPLEHIKNLSAVDDGCRSCVGTKVSLMIPKNHQANPQLVCTAALGFEHQTGNVLSMVDLQGLVRQADTWRRGAFPTTGINIFSVIEDDEVTAETSGVSDLVSQVVRRSPRYLVVHSEGITILTRLRPADLLHIALLHPHTRERVDIARGGVAPVAGLASFKQLDFDWLMTMYGKVEVAVMLLTLICNHAVNPDAADAAHFASSGSAEELLSQTLASRPSQDVIQRAQEQFTKMGNAGTAALYQYFVRATSSLWTTPFSAPFWETLWASQQFYTFVAPLEGLQSFLSQLVPAGGLDNVHRVYDARTGVLVRGGPGTLQATTHYFMTNVESFSEIYDQINQQVVVGGQPRLDQETLRMVEVLSRKGLLAVVERTVEAMKILRALECLTVDERRAVVARITDLQLCNISNGLLVDESEGFTDALMSELLRIPNAVERVWPVWRQCSAFFDPAAVDFYDARKRILSLQSAGNSEVIRDAIRQLERPEIAPCLLRSQGPNGTGECRLQIICADLRAGRHYHAAMHLAMLAARQCDPDNRAERYHASFEPDAAAHGVDPANRADLESACEHFNARRIAYVEIINTLTILCGGSGDELMEGAADGHPEGSEFSIRAQQTSAVEWAFGAAAGRYYDSINSQKGTQAKPLLLGELFQSSDRLLHYFLYTWVASRPDGSGLWPSRSDLARIRPSRSTQPAPPVCDSLQAFLSAGHFGNILRNPDTQWNPSFVEGWRNLWDGWHVGLLNDLANYCEALDEGVDASCVRLTLAHASSDLLAASPDFVDVLPNLLTVRIDILVKAEAAASRDHSPRGRQMDQWLQTQKPSAVAGVQFEMLKELPHEAWAAPLLQNEQQEMCSAQDQAALQGELLSAAKLYEMLHESYDEAVPHLAIKLLRIMGVERPELKHFFASSSNVGPWKVSDYVIKLLERHRRMVGKKGVEALVGCFTKLQDAAGIDQGIVHHASPPFMPLQLVLSGLEEMAMELRERECGHDGALIPEGNLCNPAACPASIVPRIVSAALGWPNSRVLYDAYRMLWTKVERAQTQDLLPTFRGNQVDDTNKVRRGVIIRLIAVLGQLCLQWLDRYEQDLAHPQSNFSFQQLTREYPVYADDIEQMAVTCDTFPDTPPDVRTLVDVCKQRLSAFSNKVRLNQPIGPRKGW